MSPTEHDTADRSLAHWSEAGRREMEAFYALARLDYEHLAKALDWPEVLAVQASQSSPVRLMDVACGSGKFPEALLEHTELPQIEVDYALLDPSAFSLEEAAAVLRTPFTAGERFESTLEDLDPAAGPYDVVWATHALYALEPAKLDAAVARYLELRKPEGFSFLAQGARGGHYLDVYAAFLEGVRDGAGTPYVASQDLIAGMQAAGAEPEVRRIAYDHEVREDDRAVLEGYLQRCLFDDTLSLEELLAAPVLGAYLDGCHDAAAGLYRFHQEVDLVVLHPTERHIPWK